MSRIRAEIAFGLLVGSGFLIYAAAKHMVIVGLFGARYLLAAIDGLARARALIVADNEGLRIRNKWRTHDVPLTNITNLSVETVRWRVKKGWATRGISRRETNMWSVGVLSSADGRRIFCDSLIGLPEPPDGPIEERPIEAKLDVLRRWCDPYSFFT